MTGLRVYLFIEKGIPIHELSYEGSITVWRSTTYEFLYYLDIFPMLSEHHLVASKVGQLSSAGVALISQAFVLGWPQASLVWWPLAIKVLFNPPQPE